MLDAARYNNVFFSGTRHCVLQLGQKIVTEPHPSSSEDDEDVQLEPEDYQQSGPVRVTKSISKKTGGSGGGGRSNVTLRDLVDTNLLEPCKDCIVVSYKGTSYTASLDDDGAIVYQGKRFTSATAFSMHCKRLQTPGKQGDDGWKSVHYAGKPLDTYRCAYLRTLRQKQSNGAASGSSNEGATAGRADDDTQDGAAQSGDARQPAEGEEDTDQWVQCERCKRWRVVPDEHWQEVSADEGSAWLCENALWDVLDKPPHEPACDPA